MFEMIQNQAVDFRRKIHTGVLRDLSKTQFFLPKDSAHFKSVLRRERKFTDARKIVRGARFHMFRQYPPSLTQFVPNAITPKIFQRQPPTLLLRLFEQHGDIERHFFQWLETKAEELIALQKGFDLRIVAIRLEACQRVNIEPALESAFHRLVCETFSYLVNLFTKGRNIPEQPSDYHRRRALYLPKEARWSYLVAPPEPHDNLGQAVVAAMETIEAAFEPLRGVLPKEYTIFERTVLEDLLRIFNREALNTVSGDVFGRIYEYFLMNFAMQGAQDSGEFFTPPSLVQTIVNVIGPEHGKVFDPACGSGGMFVQSSYFIERLVHDAAKRVVFYGQEKTATTIKLAKMNLAVHGLQGEVREANTFYQDEHNLFNECDFVMANPPLNVTWSIPKRVERER